jgi:hypothetical protein
MSMPMPCGAARAPLHEAVRLESGVPAPPAPAAAGSGGEKR